MAKNTNKKKYINQLNEVQCIFVNLTLLKSCKKLYMINFIIECQRTSSQSPLSSKSRPTRTTAPLFSYRRRGKKDAGRPLRFSHGNRSRIQDSQSVSISSISSTVSPFTPFTSVWRSVSGETFQEHEKCGLQEIGFLQVPDPWLSVQKNTSYKEMFKIGYENQPVFCVNNVLVCLF